MGTEEGEIAEYVILILAFASLVLLFFGDLGDTTNWYYTGSGIGFMIIAVCLAIGGCIAKDHKEYLEDKREQDRKNKDIGHYE
jgi:hypothetical protein